MTVSPKPEQIKALVESELEGPVVMINLLKFAERSKADGDVSGRQSYQQYGDQVRSMLEKVGARVLWQGRVDSVVIGDEADHWDTAILVEYPSRKAFLQMTSSQSYGDAAKQRTSGLADSRLLATTEIHRLKGD